MNQKWAQKGLCPLADRIWASQDQDIIQIYKNKKTLVLAKEQ